MIFVFDSSVARYLKVLGIVIWPFVFITHKKEDTPPSLMKHEFVHVHQIRREGIIWFYLHYLFCVACYYWKTGNLDRGFVDNVWEHEAYSLENNALSDEEVSEVKWTGARTDSLWNKEKRMKVKEQKSKSTPATSTLVRKSSRLLASNASKR